MTTPSNYTPEPSPKEDAPDSWERVAGELRACKESQKRVWGDLDSSTLGRYLAGEVVGDELGHIERELADHPELRQLADLVRDVLGGLGSAAPSPSTRESAPTVLSFEKARKPRRVLPFLRRYAALAVAACLLVVLGGKLLPSGETRTAMAPGEVVSFLGDGVALAAPTSPVVMFTTVGSPTPSEVAIDDPLPPGGDRGWTRDGAKVARNRGKSSVVSARRTPEYKAGRAPEKLALVNATDVKKSSSSVAASNHRLGLDQLRRGEVSEAEKSLALTYAHCQDRLGSNHPFTTRAAQDLANLYAPALNEGPNARSFAMAAPLGATISPLAAPPLEVKRQTPEAERLAEQIASQTLPQIQATVVPVLIRALETAPTPAQRQTMVLALGNLGPAASPALPALQQSLVNATPAETQAILSTMGLIGPASVPVLNQLSGMNADKATGDSAKTAKDRANLSARDQRFITVTLRKLQSPEAQAGIADEAACLSFREIRTASMQLHRLAKAKDSGILVLIRTKAANRPDDADRLAPLGKRGVLVVIDPSGGVEVKVSPALEEAGFSAANVRDAMLGPCKAKQYDKACSAGVGLILAQAARLKSSRP